MTIWCMCIACWIINATYTLRLYKTHCFHGNNAYTKARQCYIICTLPVLYILSSVFSKGDRSKAVSELKTTLTCSLFHSTKKHDDTFDKVFHIRCIFRALINITVFRDMIQCSLKTLCKRTQMHFTS
jgi:hypothetical protein